MLKKEVLRNNSDFAAIYRRGKSIGDRFVVVFLKKNNLDYNRLAFLASKKVGNSVQRNRARRLMKESFRKMNITDINGHDIIFVARNTINDKKCDEVKRSMESAIRRSRKKKWKKF